MLHMTVQRSDRDINYILKTNQPVILRISNIFTQKKVILFLVAMAALIYCYGCYLTQKKYYISSMFENYIKIKYFCN
jgi:hypothetical protein